MVDKLLKLNIRILLSYLAAALWTYYVGFGLAKLFDSDTLKLIFIVGMFIISFVLSFGITIIILPKSKPIVIKHRWLRILCITILSLFVLIALMHVAIWAILTDVISLQVKPQDDFLELPGISSVKSYVYSGMLDSSYMFKFKAEPDTVSKIVSHFNLIHREDLNNSDKKNIVKVISEGHYGYPTPYWWVPKFNTELQFYESDGTTNCDILMYDPKTKTVYMEIVYE